MDNFDSKTSPTTDRAASWPIVRQWIAVLVIAGFVRGGILVARFSALHADPDAYRLIAENLANEGTFGRADRDDPGGEIYPTAYRPPLYPLLLTPLVINGQLSLAATAALHFVLGLATVAGVAWFGGMCGLGRSRFVAAMVVACDPLLVNQSTLVMTETLAALNAILVLIAVERLRTRGTLTAASVAGGAIGLAALCRPTFLPFVLGVAALEFCFVPTTSSTWRQRLVRAAVVVLSAVIVVSPWAVRNQLQFERPIASTTHGGYTLLLGNNPGFYKFLRTSQWGDVWEPESAQALIAGCHQVEVPGLSLVIVSHSRVHGDELTEDSQLNACAWTNIRNDPWSAARAAAYRVGQLWSPLAHRQNPQESLGQRILRWGAAVWYLLVFSAALFGLLRLGRQACRGPWLAGLLLCLLFTLVHSLYWSNLRMRAPLMPFVALLALTRKSGDSK